MNTKLFSIIPLLSVVCAHSSFGRSDAKVPRIPLSAPLVGLMNGKISTDRTILLEATVDAAPAEVFRLWTTPDGVKKFFAPAAKINAKAGGRYQIIFSPSKDPEGNSHGTKGARILKFAPGKQLAFEWITFAGDDLLGDHAPPFAPAAERNMKPLPTWVEMNFAAVAGEPNRTHIRFAHYGFREGERWEKSYRWFGHAWKGVLDELTDYCAKQQS